MMINKAVVIGIDHYAGALTPLSCCVNDANSIGKILEKNSNQDPNFEVEYLLSDDSEGSKKISTLTMKSAISNLFSKKAHIALLYFAGHGVIDKETNHGYLANQNGSNESWGMPISHIIELANKSHSLIDSCVIILDCCHSGCAGNLVNFGYENLSVIGEGVTILTACRGDEFAEEAADGHGLFTSILLNGLEGGSADILGYISPASLYNHIDQTLGRFEQRPIYKTNVDEFISLRKVEPKIPLVILRKLTDYFQDANYVINLDPSYEPDRENIPDNLKDFPINLENVKIFKNLQKYIKQGLIETIDTDHLYYAAIEFKSCKLTFVGKHYWKLAKEGRF